MAIGSIVTCDIAILSSFLCALFFSFITTLYLVPVFCALARRTGFIDNPDGVIKNHKVPVPYMGGLAVYGGFLMGLLLFVPTVSDQLFFLLVGATFLLLVGLWDDLLSLSPWQKYAGQLIAVLCFLRAGLYVKEDFFYSYIWGIPLSCFWMLSIINAFNLIDVMDGLTATTSMGVIAIFLVLSVALQQYQVFVLLGALLGAVVAFFAHNRPPARIYLGDSGALFLGGFFAAIPFSFKWGCYNSYGFLVPCIVLAVPSLEIMGLVIMRSYKKLPIYLPSPDHFSLKLLARGWTKRAVLVLVGLLSLAAGALALLVVFNMMPFIFLLLLGLFCLFLWFFFLGF
jgi:UDP-GlcNAc:undecaprenyl-phosphate GlcNAc-1-phosphate transferase